MQLVGADEVDCGFVVGEAVGGVSLLRSGGGVLPGCFFGHR